MSTHYPFPTIGAVGQRLKELGCSFHAEAVQTVLGSIRLVPDDAPSHQLPLGASRLGGSPDAPPGFEWPQHNGRPLTFIGQIDLEEVKTAILPSGGWLLFFYDNRMQPWGFDPKDAGSWRVCHVEAARETLVPLPHPPIHEADYTFRCHRVSFAYQLGVPDQADMLWAAFDLALWDQDAEENPNVAALEQVLEELSGVEKYAPHHHLLGHPQHYQSDMRWQLELASRGQYCGTADSLDTPEAEEIMGNANLDWSLLLQIDSDPDKMGFVWGDLGRIYFWIRNSDLERGDFSRVWLALQCG